MTNPTQQILKREIDASGQSLGRVASLAASMLMGKDTASFARNKMAKIIVTISNADKLHIKEAKLTDKIYVRYTGYPGGLYKTKLGKMIEQKGNSAPLRKAILGMLPKNKLTPDLIKNLIILG